MDSKELNINKENKSVIFVCRHCGDLFWDSEERDIHRKSCSIKNKIIDFNRNFTGRD